MRPSWRIRMTPPIAPCGRCGPTPNKRRSSGARGRDDFVLTALVLALQEMIRELPQARPVGAEDLKRAPCFPGELVRLLAGSLQSYERGIGGLLRGGVFPGALAKLFAGLRDIENVVDDLEGE